MPLPQVARDEIVALVERVRASVAGVDAESAGAAREVRWVRLDGVHLTLRFLGPTPDERIPAIEGAIRRAVQGVPPFAVRIGGGGAFPHAGRPRVLWLGVTAGAEQMAALAAVLEDGLVAAGWERDERPFKAHLTLARSDGVRAGPETARALIRAGEEFVADWTADRLVLFESHTGRGPASYEPLIEVPLGR